MNPVTRAGGVPAVSRAVDSANTITARVSEEEEKKDEEEEMGVG